MKYGNGGKNLLWTGCWSLYSTGLFMRELSFLEVLMIKVCRLCQFSNLKPIFLGEVCFNCALRNTWPFMPDLQRLPCGKANSLLWISKAPLRSLVMTWARAAECAGEWAPTLYSFPVCFPAGGFLTYILCIVTTLAAPPSSLVPWPSVKEADLLDSTISNSKLDTGSFQKHTVCKGACFPDSLVT